MSTPIRYLLCTFCITVFCFLFVLPVASAQVAAMAWMKGLGGGGGDKFRQSIRPMPDGGFVVNVQTSSLINTGNIDSFCNYSNKRGVFIKFNADASAIDWSICHGADGDSDFVHVFPLTNGDFVFGGQFRTSVGMGWLITRHDVGGNVLWQLNYSKGSSAFLRDMVATNDGGYLMMGESHMVDTNVLLHYGGFETFDIWLLKVDSNGYKQWSRTIGGTEHESGAALVPAPGNGYYIVGGTGSYDYDCTGNPGGGTAYVVRVDDTGGIVWHRCVGGSKHDAATSACANGKGGVILAVNSSSTDYDVHDHIGGSDYWVAELDSAGNLLWTQSYGTTQDEVPLAIGRSPDGDLWLNGFNYNNYDDVYIVHTDSVGNLLHECTLSSSGQDRGQIAWPLNNGFVFIGGYYEVNNGTFSTVTKHYGAFDAFYAIYTPWGTNVPATTMLGMHIPIYPNPAEKMMYIDTRHTHDRYNYTITDMGGRKVADGKTSRNEVTGIDIAQLPPATYSIRLHRKGITEYTQMIAIR